MERGNSFSSTSSASTSSSILSSDDFNSCAAPLSQSMGTLTPLSEITPLIDEEKHQSSTSKAPQSRIVAIHPDLVVDTKNVAPPAYNGTLAEVNRPTDAVATTNISQSQTLPTQSRPAEAPRAPAALTRTQTAPNSARSYGQAAQPHPLSPLEHEYDPSRDDASIDELLARPRLPRTPYERFVKKKLPMTAEEIETREIAEAKARAEDLERRKTELRLLALGLASLKK